MHEWMNVWIKMTELSQNVNVLIFEWLLWCVLMCLRVCPPVCQSGVWFACWTLLALSRTSITQPGPSSTTWQVISAAWTWSQCSSTPCFVCFLFLAQRLIFNVSLIDQKSQLLLIYLNDGVLSHCEQLIHQTTHSWDSWCSTSWALKNVSGSSPPKDKTRRLCMGSVPLFGR